MKIYILSSFFYIFIYYIESTSGISVSPQSAEVLFGNSIRLTIKSSPLLPFSNCTITTPKHDQFYTDDLIFNDTVIQIIESEPDCIQWIDLERCTVVISNFSEYSQGQWTFEAYASNGSSFSGKTHIFLTPLPPINSTITTTLGSFAYIDCSLKDELRPKYCIIIDNCGKTISNTCSLTINPVKKEHEGTWKCKIGLASSIREIIHDVIVKIKSDENVIGIIKQETTFIELKCTLRDSTFIVYWCRALTPTGEYLMLSEGLVTNKYSSFSTNFKERTCSIEIYLPLNTNTDIGRWRIDIGGNIEDFTGCFFNVPDNNNTKLPVSNNVEKRESVEIGKSQLFKCSVPWTIQYCYVKSPNGEFIYSTSSTAVRLQRVGVCQIIVNNMTLSGKWTCGVSSQYDTEDIQLHTHVDIISDELTFGVDDDKPIVGKPFHFICKSPLEKPLRYCRFISPISKGYSVQSTNLQTSNGKSSNLDEGMCILHIEKLRLEDLGTWTCAASFASMFIQEKYATTSIKQLEQNLASVIGIAMAAIIVFVGVLLFVIYRVKKRRANNTSTIGNSNEAL